MESDTFFRCSGNLWGQTFFPNSCQVWERLAKYFVAQLFFVLGEKFDGSFRQATGWLASFHGAQGVNKNSKMEGRQPIEVGSLSQHYLQGFIHSRWLVGFLNHQQRLPKTI